MDARDPSTGTEWIDPDDAPELSESFFERADKYQGEELIERGQPDGCTPITQSQSPP